MTLDGFLTALALAIAVFSVSSSSSRLKFALHAKWQVLVAVFSFSLVMYFEFFELVGQACPSAFGKSCSLVTFTADSVFTPADAAFVSFCCWIALALLIHTRLPLTGGSIPALRRLIDNLMYEKRYSEIVEVVEPYLGLIDKAIQRQLPLQKFWEWTTNFVRPKGIPFADIEQLLGGENAKVRDVSFVEKVRQWFFGKNVHQDVEPSRVREEADEIVRTLFRSTDFRDFVAEMRPYFAIPLMKIDDYRRYDFSDAYFEALISDPGSILYDEFRQNQNTSASGYHYPTHNKLLYFLFSDAQTAKTLAVWSPIGELTLKTLREDSPINSNCQLNRKFEDFDSQRWKDPVASGIFFFDLMVKAAAHQGVKWHMWLYYFPLFVEELEKKYDTSNAEVSEDDEFPVAAARLIYECVDCLGDWVGLISHLPEKSPHRSIQPGMFGDNGNIPVSAARALGQVAKAVIMSDRIGIRFASHMHECVLRDVRELGSEGAEGQLRAYFIKSILTGGGHGIDIDYGHRLAELLKGVDHVLLEYIEDYKSALKETYPDCLSEGC